MNILPGDTRFGAGQPVKRLEDHRLLTGKGAFIDDKPEDGALWLYVLRSPHAHAKIVSIDTRAATGMAGIEALSYGGECRRGDLPLEQTGERYAQLIPLAAVAQVELAREAARA